MSLKRLFTCVMLLLALGAMSLAHPAIAQQPFVTVTKSVTPEWVCVVESEVDPMTFTVTICVEGSGGVIEDGLPIDIVHAIDSSGSMASEDPGDLRLAAAKSFTDMLSADDQAGVVSWDNNVDFTHPLTYLTASGKTMVKAKIDLVDHAGGTVLDAGLSGAMGVLDANTRTDPSVEVILFLSDGNGVYTFSGHGGPIDDIKARGYTVYTIGLGSAPAEAKLEDIASYTGGKYYSAPTAENLQDVYNEIFEEVIISTAPKDVDVVEVTSKNVVDIGGFTKTPDSVTATGGKTTIIWRDIGDRGDVGDGEDPFISGEQFCVSFEAKYEKVGDDLPVDHSSAEVTYTDPNGNPGSVPIPQAYIDVDLCSPEDHDVEAVSQTAAETSVEPGTLVDIDVTVANPGDFTESFDVTCYYDGVPIGTKRVNNLASGASTTVTFNWDTTGVPVDDYLITAWADSATEITEVDETNNWCPTPLSIFVIPELAFGAILGVAACIAALVVFIAKKRKAGI